MPRPRPLYLYRRISRHGKPCWYVNRPGQHLIRLYAEYGTKQFNDEYRAALAGNKIKPPTAVKKASRGTLTWLWDQYRTKSGEWKGFSGSTRRQRENVMLGVLEKNGDTPIEEVTSKHIAEGRDRRAGTPTQSKCFMVIMRKLFAWALTELLVEKDPTVGVKLLKKVKTQGFPVWTEEDVALYEARWPLGTKERVWLDVLLYTGLRRGDAARLGRQHVKNGVATMRTEKSQGGMVVTLPILPALQRTLDAGPVGELAFIVGASGKPLAKESFGNFFREACDAAGVHGKSAHGVRKIGATRAADNGATVTELEAIFGWEGGGMAALYTKSADRKRASLRAMELVQKADAKENEIAPLCDHPKNRWSQKSEKSI
jgi:integrase